MQPRRTARALISAGALLLALAACQPREPADAQPAQAGQAAPAAQAAPAQSGTAATGEPVVEERLATANCRQPAEGRVFFGIGDAVFAVPGGDVRTVVPPNVTPTTQAAQIVEQLRAETARGAGCPESPLATGLLGVAGPAGDPLLADQLALFRSQPGGISTPYGRLTREMLGSSDKCRPSDGGLLACPALETDGPEQTETLYFVSTDRARTLEFGGPLAARCVILDDRIRGCEIVDELPGGVGLRAPLTAVPQSTAALAAAHRAAIQRVRGMRI